jgi:type II secretory pathway component PulF
MNQPAGPINVVLLAVPALALLVAMRILLGRFRRPANDPAHVLLSVSATIMFLFAGAGFVFGLVGYWLLFIPLPIFAMVVLLMFLDRTRRSQHRGLIWALATAANRGIPLPEAARAFADETPGRTGARALRLAEALERGQPLAEARRDAGLRMGTAMRLTVQMAEPLGMLGPAMRQQLDDSQQVDAALRDVIGRFFYLANVIVFMLGICTFVMLKIVPVFQRIFEEFGIKLPALTNAVINASAWFVRIGWLPSLPLLAIALPVFIVGAALFYTGYFPRNVPLVWRLFKRFDGAIIMRALALAVRRQMPLPAALRLVAESYPLSIVGNRLQTATERVEAGSDWCDSLRQTGFIARADAAVLNAAQRVGNLDWALEEMAASSLRRQAYRLQIALQLLFPAALLALAACVFLFVCGLFLPLVVLIQALA